MRSRTDDPVCAIVCAALACALCAATTVRAQAPVTDVDAEADALLARAGKEPHNGHNPTIDVKDAELSRLAPALQRVVVSGACARRRDAVSLLARLPAQQQRTFWREQLAHRDQVVRFFSIVKLADVADPRDFEVVARQVVAAPPMQHAVSVRLRDWKDRRAVPVLAALLDTPHASNAALSLSELPFCPRLPPDTGPAQHHESGAWIQPTDPIAPYRRWWKERGAAAFAVEATWWNKLRSSTQPDPPLVPDTPCGGD